VLLVERLPRTGGDCTWHGCVPSKALIRCARAVAETRGGARFGVAGVDLQAVRTDWEAVKQHVQACQAKIYTQDDSPEQLAREGVEVLCGRSAAFSGPNELALSVAEGWKDPDGGADARKSVTAERFVICTGAGPTLPKIAGLEQVPYATYETIFSLPSLPPRLLVVGGGPIGAELAQAFARLGSEVTIVAKLLPREDDDVREVMKRAFAADGIKVVEGRATSARRSGATVSLEAGGSWLEADALLISAGRQPKGLKELGLDKAGVKWSEERGIEVNAKLQTTAKHIYAAGDCLGGLQFTHLAGYQGGIAAWNALLPVGTKAPCQDACPRCTFTHPEVATVGLTEPEAKAKFGEAVVATVRHLDHVDRAVCEGETDGFVKVLHTRKGKVLGATVVASVAGELASELGLAIAAGVTVNTLAQNMHAYPTFAFALFQMASELRLQSFERSSALACLRRCCGRRLRGTATGEHPKA